MWTREMPKEEGWYWFRCDGLTETIVQVYEDADLEMMMVGPDINCIRIIEFLKQRDIFDDLMHQDGEWQPVADPVE